jgi:hypothetical protein
MNLDQNRLKQLDLLGGLGAGVLGAGLALLFARRLEPFAVPALVIGIVAHGWAMYAKSRLEHQAGIGRLKWAVAAEWACWAMLAALLAYIGFDLLT